MMYRHVFIAIILTVIPAFSVWAHEGMAHVVGTVTESGTEQLVIKARDGKTVSVMISPQTRFLPRGSATTSAVPQVGDRVVVELSGDTAVPTASEVRFSSPVRTHAR